MREFEIKLNEQEIQIIAQSLVKEPYGLVCKLIDNLNNQVKNYNQNEIENIVASACD
ncbi:MAG: hypothetical protein ACRDD7_18275 [Peptostreptococcaceae bacterium]